MSSSSSLFFFFFFPLQIRNLWNEEEDDEERDEIILVLVIYGFGLCWVCIVFEEICGMRRKMTKREMGNYLGFGLGFCSYVLFWFVLGKAEHRERGKGRALGLRRLLLHFFFKCYFFNNMLMWKFVGTSKVSVLYIYRLVANPCDARESYYICRC